MTTPGAMDVASCWRAMRDRGCRACAIEASSHALDQSRVAGVRFAGRRVHQSHRRPSRLSQDDGQLRGRQGHAVRDPAARRGGGVNADDEYSQRMIRDSHGPRDRLGLRPPAPIIGPATSPSRPAAPTSCCTRPTARREVQMQLIGRHNIENALCAAALVGEVFGLSVHQIAVGLERCARRPGRLQAVRSGQPFAVLVDYAAHGRCAGERPVGARAR